MNKNLVFQLLIIVFLLLNLVSFSQVASYKFNGVITYSLSYEGNAEQSVLAQQQKEFEIKYSGNIMRTDLDEGGTSISVIKDCDTKTIFTLMDVSILNKKVMIKTSRDEINNKLAKGSWKLETNYNETKSIAGYKCRKGELIIKDVAGKEHIDEFYYTEELGKGEYNFESPYRDIKGILMEFVKHENNIKITVTALKVDRKTISEKEFMIPKGYEEMTLEQLSKLFSN